MSELTRLEPGDSVELVAPAARCSDELLFKLKSLLELWGLKCILPDDIFGKDLLCANSDEARFNFFKNAIEREETKAIICARGGYGSMRIIPQLLHLKKPKTPKLFVGMSDITALHLFLMQQWHWPVLHAGLALDKFSEESIAAVKSVMFGEVKNVNFAGKALNNVTPQNNIIESELTGGNLCLVQSGLGTSWQIETKNKIIFLEEVNERGYRVDRMFEQLRQAHVFRDAKAIVFGDFMEGKEPDGSNLVTPVLERFALTCDIPVIKIEGVGHGRTSLPLPMGTPTKIELGKNIKLSINC